MCLLLNIKEVGNYSPNEHNKTKSLVSVLLVECLSFDNNHPRVYATAEVQNVVLVLFHRLHYLFPVSVCLSTVVRSVNNQQIYQFVDDPTIKYAESAGAFSNIKVPKGIPSGGIPCTKLPRIFNGRRILRA